MTPAQVNLSRVIGRRLLAARLSPVARTFVLMTSTWSAHGTRSGAMSVVSRQDVGRWKNSGAAAMLAPFLSYRPDREGD